MSNEIAVCTECGHSVRDHYREGDIKLFQCWHRNSYENNDFCGCQHGAPKAQTFAFYAVANNEDLSIAKWYRTYSSNSNSGWVSEFATAKIWTRRGQAQGMCSRLGAGSYLIEFIAGQVNIIDQRVRLKELETKKREQEVLHQKWLKSRELAMAEEALKAAQQKVERLKRG